jgi:hypothetical protein
LENQRSGIPIRIPTSDSYIAAILRYDSTGPKLEYESGDIQVISKQPPAAFDRQIIVNEAGRKEVAPINSKNAFYLDPCIIVERGYSEGGIRPEPFYPPSTNGWAGRVIDDEKKALFFVHRSMEDDRYWLSIIDPVDNQIHEAHPILPFEAGLLSFKEDFDNYSTVVHRLSADDKAWGIQLMQEILDGAPPSWQELAEITKEVYIPNLQMGKTMRETLEHIVPASFDPDTKEQIMAFLGQIIKWKHPDMDPISYFMKLESLPVLRVLLMGHLWCVVGEEAPPPYVRILLDSERQRLGAPTLTTRESSAKNSWIRAHWHINEHILQLSNTSRTYAARLNESGRIITSLPVSKSQAQRSKKKWIERFRLLTEGLLLRSHLRPRALGLTRVASLTAAHQWPHKHMKFSASLGTGGYRNPHIQIMEMPHSSYEIVLRTRPNVIAIDWSASRVNSHLFDEEAQKWSSAPSKILRSLNGKRTIRRLGNEFGAWKGSRIHHPKREWAQALDATADLSYLSAFEYPGYLEQFGHTRQSLLKNLEGLRREAIIGITYLPNLTDLVSVAILAQGDSNVTCSLARSLLSYAPSATSMVGKRGEWLLALCRLPSPDAHQLMATLPDASANRNVILRCNRTLSLRSYTWDFYQRLLLPDGSWDDDVSVMLSQIRIPFQEDTSED